MLQVVVFLYFSRKMPNIENYYDCVKLLFSCNLSKTDPILISALFQTTASEGSTHPPLILTLERGASQLKYDGARPKARHV